MNCKYDVASFDNGYGYKDRKKEKRRPTTIAPETEQCDMWYVEETTHFFLKLSIEIENDVSLT